MLPAGHRLRRGADISTVVRRGRRATSSGARLLVVHARAADAADRLPRAGFVVGRSVGGSVVRHRVIRRLRHLVRPHLATLPSGTDLVVRALPGAATASYDELDRALEGALRRATAPGRRP
ncbi:MAG TPA: ribonuclease P protein component [Actinomycetes bacterium]|nr:ribonuclease P protein component [Actinomycetes bacterium]